MTIQSVYDKYKHLDEVLSNPEPVSFFAHIAHDLWLAVKAEAEK